MFGSRAAAEPEAHSRHAESIPAKHVPALLQ
jgi:hypothetical protein